MQKQIFTSQSANATRSTQRSMDDLIERRLPTAFRALGESELASSIFYHRNVRANRQAKIAIDAAKASSVCLALYTLPWSASEFVRKHELPLFNPVTFKKHGRQLVGVMFDNSSLSASKINEYLGFNTDNAGGANWLKFKGRYAYTELRSDAERDQFTVEIAQRLISCVSQASEVS